VTAAALSAIEAEVAVLGGLLCEPQRFADVDEVLTEGDFGDAAHRMVWRALRSLRDAGVEIDVVTLLNHLRSAGELEAIGGTEYLAQLNDAVPTAANIAYHAGIVREKAHLRDLDAIGREVVMLAGSGATGEEVQEEVERRLAEAAQGRTRQSEPSRMGPLLVEVFARLEAGDTFGVRTGFSEFDEMTLGLQPGDLAILAARPSMGKTALGLQMAKGMAGSTAKPVPIFSLEMTREACASRLLFGEAGVNAVSFKRSGGNERDFARLTDTSALLNLLPLLIEDRACTVREMRSHCRSLAAKQGGVGAIVVDYLGKVRGSGRYESRVHELGEITGDLKRLAVEMAAPVLLLCQLSRAVEQRVDKRPMLSDLRDSGEIEQDADSVMFLYRPSYYQNANSDGPEPSKGKEPKAYPDWYAELIIAKQRNGPTGRIVLEWIPDYARFSDRASSRPMRVA
jgi:replicative DNA helicase